MTVKCTFFSSSQGTFTMKNHILCHKTHLTKFQRIENVQCMLSDKNEIKLADKNRKISRNISQFR